MARMFYTLGEAAEKLGVNEDQIKQMASSGQLQQFRDGNKLMFKRDQVEAIGEESAGEDSEISLEESASPIPLAGSGDTDQIDLSEASKVVESKAEAGQASAFGSTINSLKRRGG